MTKAAWFAFATIVLVACAVTPAFAQQGTIFNYTIHVDFFAYSCNLSITQVSLYDSGSLLGIGSSPYGAEVEISIRSPTPVSTLTATASGLATWSSLNWPVSGSRSIGLGATGVYWVTITMS